jgi:hypothetical protein
MAVISSSRMILVDSGYELGPLMAFPPNVTVLRYIVCVIVIECKTSSTLDISFNVKDNFKKEVWVTYRTVVTCE